MVPAPTAGTDGAGLDTGDFPLRAAAGTADAAGVACVPPAASASAALPATSPLRSAPSTAKPKASSPVGGTSAAAGADAAVVDAGAAIVVAAAVSPVSAGASATRLGLPTAMGGGTPAQLARASVSMGSSAGQASYPGSDAQVVKLRAELTETQVPCRRVRVSMPCFRARGVGTSLLYASQTLLVRTQRELQAARDSEAALREQLEEVRRAAADLSAEFEVRPRLAV